MAMAREKGGDRDSALADYRRAFELIRSVYPFYSPADPSLPSAPSSPFDEPEQRLLADLDGAIRRLDPDAPDVLRGGLRFVGCAIPHGRKIPHNWSHYPII